MGNFLDAAYKILKGAGRPMHGKEIARIGLERGMFTSSAEDPMTVVNTLYNAARSSKDSRGFTALGNGYFGLEERDGTSQQPMVQTARRQREHGPGPAAATPSGISLEMLELTRRAMSADQFRQVWGPIYEQLLAEERAKAITTLTDASLKDLVRKPVRRIQEFLQGRGNDSPKSEEICDWIHFCYTLELYREAAALWLYVSPEEVHPWQYERTKRVAAVCRTKI